MKNDYDNLKEFWDKAFENQEVEKIEGKWVNYDSFNSLIKKYIKEGSYVLDYGSGSGWGIIEINYTIKDIKGLGIDTSKKGIEYSNSLAKLSNLNNIEFKCGDEKILNDYHNCFDNIVSFNVVDVLPDEVILDILKMMHYSIKDDGYLLIGINPDYPKELLLKMGYKYNENLMYKDGVLRGNQKTKEEWIKLFTQYFELIEYTTFELVDKEIKYPRRMFVLKKK